MNCMDASHLHVCPQDDCQICKLYSSTGTHTLHWSASWGMFIYLLRNSIMIKCRMYLPKWPLFIERDETVLSLGEECQSNLQVCQKLIKGTSRKGLIKEICFDNCHP